MREGETGMVARTWNHQSRMTKLGFANAQALRLLVLTFRSSAEGSLVTDGPQLCSAVATSTPASPGWPEGSRKEGGVPVP